MYKTRAKRALSDKSTTKVLCLNSTRAKKIQRKFCRRANFQVVQFPALVLYGRWFEEAGFTPGQSVKIEAFNGKILITP